MSDNRAGELEKEISKLTAGILLIFWLHILHFLICITESNARVASLERDIKDIQDNNAKMNGSFNSVFFSLLTLCTELYSRKINESSSSFEGERGSLLKNINEFQTQIAALKSVCTLICSLSAHPEFL